MRSTSVFGLLALACTAEETGIDNSRIDGTVTWGPNPVAEAADASNGDRAAPELLPTISPAATLVAGAIDAGGDVDWYEVSTSVDIPGYDLIVRAPGAQLRVQIVDLDAPPSQVLASFDLDGGGRVPFFAITASGTTSTTSGGYTTFVTTAVGREERAAAGVRYGIRVSAIDAAPGAAYTLILRGTSPAKEQVLVGAWQEATIEERGFPVAGTNVAAWTGGDAASGWVWTGTYSMYLVRALVTEPDGEGGEQVVDADEDLAEVWLYAGTWASLNQSLPGGTRYSSTPQRVALDQEPRSLLASDAAVYTADPLVIDAVAPLVIGLEIPETEPNDPVYTADGFPPNLDLAGSSAQDLGVLSGPGFGDILSGTMALPGVGYSANDAELFRFQVPVTCQAQVALSWSALAELDAYIFTSDGTVVEYIWSYDNPDIGGATTDLVPGVDYYLFIGGYASYDSSGDTAWEALIEWF